MIHNILKDRGTRLFVILSGFFLANALIAEVIGVKIFSLEQTLGLEPVEFEVEGRKLSLNLTAGVLLWPIVFILTDLINEYFGKKGVKLLSYMAAFLIAYAFIMFYGSMGLAPADFFVTSKAGSGVANMDKAYNSVLGQGGWIIIGSLVAFIVGQIIDALIFHRIKRRTGEKKLWLRANGSTLVSQFFDSYIVLFIAFYLGTRLNSKPGDFEWPMSLFLAVGTLNYLYKALVAIILTPLLYLIHRWIENYLGKGLAAEMKASALLLQSKK
jgi:queuosine precursor transporter